MSAVRHPARLKAHVGELRDPEPQATRQSRASSRSTSERVDRTKRAALAGELLLMGGTQVLDGGRPNVCATTLTARTA
jgi:hypothetical protein